MDRSVMNIMVSVVAYPSENLGRLIGHGFLSHVFQLRVSRS